MLVVAFVNVAVVCVSLVGAEAVAQLAFWWRHGYPLLSLPRHAITTGETQVLERDSHTAVRLVAGASVREKGEVVTVTQQRTRYAGRDTIGPEMVRIALVGGSTTFGVHMSDEDTWASRLQVRLGDRAGVLNFGVPGYSSAESVVQMALIVPEFRPDVIVVYQGWNDLHNYHEPDVEASYHGHAERLQPFLGVAPPEMPTGFDLLASVSALAHLAKAVVHRAGRVDEDTTAKPSLPAFGTPDTLVDRLFLRNLRTIRRLAAADGAFLILVPQVLDTTRLHGDKGSWWMPRVRSDAAAGLMQHLNGFMHEACPATDARCVVLDGVQSLAWTHADFLDEGHFTVQGNEKFAVYLVAQLADLIDGGRVRPRGAEARR